MSRQQPAEESLLFDLPLDRQPAEPATGLEPGPAPVPEPAADDEDIEQQPLPLAASEPAPAADDAPPPPAARRDEPPEARRAAEPTAATLRLRAAAGLTDLGVCVAVVVVLAVVLLAQGLRPEPSDWPAGVLFLLTFSFLYSVLPLAFWGRTPGMTLAGLRTSSGDGRPLSFRQSVLNWLGSVLTVALAGLPLLLALGGRSLSDRVSGAVTRRLDLSG